MSAERRPLAPARRCPFPSRSLVMQRLFWSSATMKGCLVQLRPMLADAAPWYLPLLVLVLLSWLGAGVLEPRFRPTPWLHRLYLGAPVLMLAGLVADRALNVLTLEASHNEVALYLGSSAPMMERFQVLFTGYGGLEGAMLALALFALGAPSLPSLRSSSEETMRLVRIGMMTHNAAWMLLGMLLLFPVEAHSTLANLPAAPTVHVSAWTEWGWIAVFTLLVMMGGEVLVGTSRMAANQDTKLLVSRALVKTWLTGLLAWLAVFQTDVFTQAWWSRPMHVSRPHAALLVVSYATLVALFHGPLVDVEHRFSQHPRQTRTLGVGLMLAAAVVLWVTWLMVDRVHVYGDGAVAASTAWRLVSLVFLACGLLMMLPSVGYDAAQRPEAWWFRMGWLSTVAAGPLLSASTWLLVPGLFTAAAFLVLLPVFLEEDMRSSTLNQALGLVFIASVVGAPFLTQTPRNALLGGLLLLVLSNIVLRFLSRRWAQEALTETAV